MGAPAIAPAKPSSLSILGHRLPASMVECEIRYLISLDALKSSVNLRALQKTLITQAYLKPEAFNDACRSVLKYHGEDRLRPRDFSKARVQHERSSDSEGFFLVIKSPEDNRARIDLKRPLSPDVVGKWLEFSYKDTMQKLRHGIPGQVGEDENVLKCAEADIIVGCGQREKRLQLTTGIPRVTPSFAIVEVEIAKRSGINMLRSGEHSFGFLEQHGFELSRDEKELRSMFSNRRISRFGITEQMEEVLSELFGKTNRPSPHLRVFDPKLPAWL